MEEEVAVMEGLELEVPAEVIELKERTPSPMVVDKAVPVEETVEEAAVALAEKTVDEIDIVAKTVELEVKPIDEIAIISEPGIVASLISESGIHDEAIGLVSGDDLSDVIHLKDDILFTDDDNFGVVPLFTVDKMVSKDIAVSHASKTDPPEDVFKGRRRRKDHLVIETQKYGFETEVKELMIEVKEVTRQIKEEVRELKPDLTPTPEGKECLLPLSESKELGDLDTLIPITEEALFMSDLKTSAGERYAPSSILEPFSGKVSELEADTVLPLQMRSPDSHLSSKVECGEPVTDPIVHPLDTASIEEEEIVYAISSVDSALPFKGEMHDVKLAISGVSTLEITETCEVDAKGDELLDKTASYYDEEFLISEHEIPESLSLVQSIVQQPLSGLDIVSEGSKIDSSHEVTESSLQDDFVQESSSIEQSWVQTTDVDISPEHSKTRLDSDSLFGVSPADIVMKDDLLEVTVTEKEPKVITEGSILKTASGSTYVEFESEGIRSVCVCDDVVSSESAYFSSSQPSTSIAQMMADDAIESYKDKDKGQLKSAGAKRQFSQDSIKGKSKKKSIDKSVQRDVAHKLVRDTAPITASKRVDDRMLITRRTKEIGPAIDVGLPSFTAKKRVDDRRAVTRHIKEVESRVDSGLPSISSKKRIDDGLPLSQRVKERETLTDTAISSASTGAVSKYDHRVYGYMASTLSRDLKVGHSVSERTTSFSRESSFRKRSSEREDSTLSPSKTQQQKKHIGAGESKGAIPKSPQKVVKARKVESRSVSLEKDDVVSSRKTTTSQSTFSTRQTKSSTVTVTSSTSQPSVTREDRAKTGSRTTAVQQQRTVTSQDTVTSTLKQSHLYLKKSETDTPPDRSRQRKRQDAIPMAAKTKPPDSVKPRRKKRTPDSLVHQSPSKIIHDENRAERPVMIPQTSIHKDSIPKDPYHPEPSSQSIHKPLIQPTPDYSSSSSSITLDSSVVPVVALEQVSEKLPDVSEMLRDPVTPLSTVPSPESSPSIKSVLDKSVHPTSEKKDRRESAPSPSPSASPIKSVTRSDRHTSLDYSHTPPSLPSSPSRLRGQQSAGVTQLLTSEVFTRTVDASGSIEVIYRQPTTSEALRRVATVSGSRSLHESTPGSGEAEFSLIDTTDSSLSDSVALPSSSSDHDLSLDTNVRLRTSGSPASPKPTRRSLDMVHDAAGQKLRTSDLVLECTTVPASELDSYPDIAVPTSECTSPHESVPVHQSAASSVKRKTQAEHSSPQSRTQISEERLSPILDVRAVTPPRVKHKFHYVADEETTEAAFLSSPEWTELSQGHEEISVQTVGGTEETTVPQPDASGVTVQTTQTRTADGGIVTTTTRTTVTQLSSESDVQELLNQTKSDQKKEAEPK